MWARTRGLILRGLHKNRLTQFDLCADPVWAGGVAERVDEQLLPPRAAAFVSLRGQSRGPGPAGSRAMPVSDESVGDGSVAAARVALTSVCMWEQFTKEQLQRNIEQFTDRVIDCQSKADALRKWIEVINIHILKDWPSLLKIDADSRQSLSRQPLSISFLAALSERRTRITALKDQIFSRKTWRSLLKEQILAIFQQLFAFKSTKRKDDLIDAIFSHCEDLIIGIIPETLLERYDSMGLAGLPPSELLKRLPTLLLPRPLEVYHTSAEGQELMEKLSLNDLSSRRTAVLQFHKGKDLYSSLPLEELVEPHVDHIVERQLVAHGMLTAGVSKSIAASSAFYLPVRKVVNDHRNLNVTSADLNISKGNAFTQFIKEERQIGTPRPLHVLLFSTTKGRERAIGQYTHNVMTALNESFPAVEQGIRELRRSDRHVTGSQFEDVADRLHELFNKAHIAEYADNGGVRVTRSSARK